MPARACPVLIGPQVGSEGGMGLEPGSPGPALKMCTFNSTCCFDPGRPITTPEHFFTSWCFRWRRQSDDARGESPARRSRLALSSHFLPSLPVSHHLPLHHIRIAVQSVVVCAKRRAIARPSFYPVLPSSPSFDDFLFSAQLDSPTHTTVHTHNPSSCDHTSPTPTEELASRLTLLP
nr:hypothetical protein CFP56_04274 [Quercus suber]